MVQRGGGEIAIGRPARSGGDTHGSCNLDN